MPAVVPIPPIFLERMARLLGAEFSDFARSLESAPVSGLRVNTLKMGVQEFQQRSPFVLGERVPWCPEAFLIKAEDKPGRHPWHLAGAYYLQDPSAMAPAALLAPQPGERVLDLAAAPGGKATQLAASMGASGLLVANEIKDKRLGHLAMNIERWGAANAVITNETPEHLADTLGAIFDRVLVDAPCSGEGMFRKDMGARLDWSLEMVAGCAMRQRNILRVAAHLVRPGGCLLYSTCTFAPEENEGVLTEFLREHEDFHVQALPQFPGFMPGQPGWLPGAHASLQGAVRLFPHRSMGDGHFACLLKREGQDEGTYLEASPCQGMTSEQARLWKDFEGAVLTGGSEPDGLCVRGSRLYRVPAGMPYPGSLRVVHPGVWLGNFKTGRFEPAHPLALTLHAGQAGNCINLKAEDPLLVKYLRGDTLALPGPAGWVLLCVDGLGLGWGKRVQGVVKNHFPRGWM